MSDGWGRVQDSTTTHYVSILFCGFLRGRPRRVRCFGSVDGAGSDGGSDMKLSGLSSFCIAEFSTCSAMTSSNVSVDDEVRNLGAR